MTLEIAHCGGCERPSLLEDVEAAGDYDDTPIDEPHCPRCGTRLEYEGTTVETYTGTGRRRWDATIADADDVYDRARQQWGDDAQLAKLSEEAAELSAVASRALNGQADPDRFLEELVDARIMMEQFARTYSRDRITSSANDGIDRLERRLEVDANVE